MLERSKKLRPNIVLMYLSLPAMTAALTPYDAGIAAVSSQQALGWGGLRELSASADPIELPLVTGAGRSGTHSVAEYLNNEASIPTVCGATQACYTPWRVSPTLSSCHDTQVHEAARLQHVSVGWNFAGAGALPQGSFPMEKPRDNQTLQRGVLFRPVIHLVREPLSSIHALAACLRARMYGQSPPGRFASSWPLACMTCNGRPGVCNLHVVIERCHRGHRPAGHTTWSQSDPNLHTVQVSRQCDRKQKARISRQRKRAASTPTSRLEPNHSKCSFHAIPLTTRRRTNTRRDALITIPGCTLCSANGCRLRVFRWPRPTGCHGTSWRLRTRRRAATGDQGGGLGGLCVGTRWQHVVEALILSSPLH